MKLGVLLALPFALTFFARADDAKVKIEPKPTVGAKTKHSFELSFTVGEIDVVLSGLSLATITKVDGAKTEAQVEWSQFTVLLNGNEQPRTVPPYKTGYGADGNLTSISGGIVGSDVARTFLLTEFPTPDKELAKGDTTTFTLAGNKEAAIPSRKVSETYQGPEDQEGKSAYKFQVKVEEQNGEPFSLEATFWVLKDGTVVKEEGTFSNLPVPQAQGSGSGRIKVKLVS